MKSCQTALTLAISTGNTRRQAAVLLELTWIKWRVGDYPTAQLHVKEAQTVAQLCGDFYRYSEALKLEGMCWAMLGKYTSAIFLFKRATDTLGLFGLSDSTLYLGIRADLAEVHKLKSEYPEALEIQIKVLEQFPVNEKPYRHAYTLLDITDLGVSIGSTKHDLEINMQTARSIFVRLGYLRGESWCDLVQGRLHLREGNCSEAKILLEKCLRQCWGKYADLTTSCLEDLARGSRWRAADWTDTWTVVFLAYVLKLNQKLEIYKALQFLGDVFLTQGDLQTASSLFTVALGGFTHMDVHRSRADCMLQLGDISRQSGDTLEATEYWTAARPLFKRSSQVCEVTRIDERVVEMEIGGLPDNLGRLSELCAPTGVSKMPVAGNSIKTVEQLDSQP
jgi:tetratricopeptide (TPR) repeat protein